MLQYIVIVGGLANLAGIFPYIRDTLRGTTKPNRITWFMWSVAPLIATAAALADGVTWAALPIFMSGFGPLLVFIFSFTNKNSYWKLEIFDWVCGGFSILALIFWWITKDPLTAIFFAILSDGSAALPTIIKAWKYPETENVYPFTTGIINAVSAFAAVKIWILPQYIFPVYLVFINLLLSISVLRKRIFKTAEKS